MSIKERALAQMGNPDWKQNWTHDGLEFKAEIRDNQNGTVWLCQQSITHQEYQTLTLPNDFSKVVIGRGTHDVAYFRRSPDAVEDSPLVTMKVGGRTFSKVARPGEIELKYMKQGYKEFLLLTVHKYHKVMFAAGRTIEVLKMEDGKDYISCVTEALGFAGNKELTKRVLPESWSIREIILEEDLIVEIPYPARVCFFKSGHGFHGPVNL